MSILDTFYILFKTDADKAAEDIKKVDNASDQAEDGLKKVDKAVSGVGSSFLAMARNLAAPLLTLASVGSVLSVALERAAAVRELDQFSSKLNASISDVDAFQRSVKAMGGETAAALDSLVKIGEKVNEAFSDKESGAAKDFKEWGLAFKNTKGEAFGASEAMIALAGNLEKVSRAEALARIKKLGIEDAGTIDLLLKGRVALEERIRAEKELGVVTEEQARQTREYYGEMGRAQNALLSLGNSILSAALPAMTALAKGFADVTSWIARNQTLVKGFFIGLATVITVTYLPAIAAAAAATFVALAPFIAIGAAIAAVGAAFALAYEDVVAFLDGQPSLIGALAERYEWFRVGIEAIGDVFNALKTTGTAALEGIGPAFEKLIGWSTTLGEGVGSFWAQFRPVWESVKQLVSAVGDLLGAVWSRIAVDIPNALTGVSENASRTWNTFLDGLGPIGEAVRGVAKVIESAFTGAFNAVMWAWDNTIGALAGKISAIAGGIRNLADYIRGGGSTNAPANDNTQTPQGAQAASAVGGMFGDLRRGQQALANAAAAPINGQTAQSIAGAPVTNVTNTTTVGNVTVNTQATDAKGVAAAVRGELRKQLTTTASQFDDGVAN